MLQDIFFSFPPCPLLFSAKQKVYFRWKESFLQESKSCDKVSNNVCFATHLKAVFTKTVLAFGKISNDLSYFEKAQITIIFLNFFKYTF